MSSTRAPLVLVPTPIGNLEDITLLAQRALSEADVVVAEDTRVSGRLLQHLGLQKPLVSFHTHNEHRTVEGLVERLQRGERIALVSDAGTPGISDPGFLLVRAAVQAGIAVECLPGPTAFVPALVVSGLPCERFVFEGFLPAKSGARRSRIEALAAEPRTLIFYESAHRIREMLEDAAAGFGGDRLGCVAREVSKRFETIRRDALASLRAWVESDANQQRGEFVVLVAGADEPEDAKLEAGRSLYRKLVEHLPPSQAARVAAEISGAPRKALYGGESA